YDGPAERHAELVAVEERSLCERILTTARNAVTAIAIGLEGGAVKLVGPALARHDDGGRAGELGRGIVQLHLELLNGIEPGRAAEIPSFPDLVHRSAVEQGGAGVRAHPVGL